MREDSTRTAASSYFVFIACVFVAVLLISNVAAQKLFAFGPFTFSGGILLFPIGYIFGDVLTEVYGYARSRQVIWAGLLCNLLMAGFLWLVVQLPPAQGWPLQDQFATVLSLIPRVVVASTIGYWAGEFANSFVLAKLKVRTSGRFLWVRTIGSTIVGEGVDTVLFVLIAFAGVFPQDLLVRAIWSGYLFKVLYEVVATPLTYAVVRFLKRAEGIDVYDRNTDFSPFRLRAE